MSDMFTMFGAFMCSRPWLLAIVGIVFIVASFKHFKRSKWHLRAICGAAVMLSGLVWLAAAGLEEHTRRWAEANVESVPIRVDLIIVPLFIFPFALLAVAAWLMGFIGTKEKTANNRIECTP
jgi:chromate transport protein ChrA